MTFSIEQLRSFITQSNLIEGVTAEVTPAEYMAYERFLALPEIKVADILALAGAVPVDRAPALRNQKGMDVLVGNHRPPAGSPQMESALRGLLSGASECAQSANMAYDLHRDFESLHPLMDGNGRTGRALFLWTELRGRRHRVLRLPLGFLHEWYYRSLDSSRR